MPKTDRFRALYVLKYLWEISSEEHPVTLVQIQQHLSETMGIEAIPKTIDRDISELQNLGFDIIRNRSTQYQYFFASRYFNTFELKLMIDAVQAAHFISKEQTDDIVRRIAQLGGDKQSDELRRNLFVSKLKGDNANTLLIADWLNTAINQNKKVSFQYFEYNQEGKKVLKYNGYRYKFSPYALVWNIDNYFVVGCYERREKPKIIKFRVDKICSIKIEEEERIPVPEDFDLASFCDSMFLMYGDEQKEVTLECEYSVINKIIDRFGENINISPIDDDHFSITAPVMACSTFYSWVFNYGGKIKIVGPVEVKDEFTNIIKSFINS